MYGATLANIAQEYAIPGNKLVVFQAVQGKFRASGGDDNIARPIGAEEYDSYFNKFGAGWNYTEEGDDLPMLRDFIQIGINRWRQYHWTWIGCSYIAIVFNL